MSKRPNNEELELKAQDPIYDDDFEDVNWLQPTSEGPATIIDHRDDFVIGQMEIYEEGEVQKAKEGEKKWNGKNLFWVSILDNEKMERSWEGPKELEEVANFLNYLVEPSVEDDFKEKLHQLKIKKANEKAKAIS